MLCAHEADAGVPPLNALCTNVEIYCCGKNLNANQQTNPAFEGVEKKKSMHGNVVCACQMWFIVKTNKFPW